MHQEAGKTSSFDQLPPRPTKILDRPAVLAGEDSVLWPLAAYALCQQCMYSVGHRDFATLFVLGRAHIKPDRTVFHIELVDAQPDEFLFTPAAVVSQFQESA